MILSQIYHHKYFPRIGYDKPDGGEGSGVTGYFLIEWKALFSIGILRFAPGTREAFHSHAFNAVTFWISGAVVEEQETGELRRFSGFSLGPKITKRQCCHRVRGETTTWALTFRGPWVDHWREKRPTEDVVLTHGRTVVSRVGVSREFT